MANFVFAAAVEVLFSHQDISERVRTDQAAFTGPRLAAFFTSHSLDELSLIRSEGGDSDAPQRDAEDIYIMFLTYAVFAPQTDLHLIQSRPYIAHLDMKGCICHFAKWQIHPFISKGRYISEPRSDTPYNQPMCIRPATIH